MDTSIRPFYRRCWFGKRGPGAGWREPMLVPGQLVPERGPQKRLTRTFPSRDRRICMYAACCKTSCTKTEFSTSPASTLLLLYLLLLLARGRPRSKTQRNAAGRVSEPLRVLYPFCSAASGDLVPRLPGFRDDERRAGVGGREEAVCGAPSSLALRRQGLRFLLPGPWNTFNS